MVIWELHRSLLGAISCHTEAEVPYELTIVIGEISYACHENQNDTNGVVKSSIVSSYVLYMKDTKHILREYKITDLLLIIRTVSTTQNGRSRTHNILLVG